MNILETVPLVLFLLSIRMIDVSIPAQWILPFGTGGIAALLCIAIQLWKNKFQHRLFLGVNLYLISGFLGILFHQETIGKMYGELQSAGMFAWVVAVSVGTIILQKSWFPNFSFKQTMKYSYYMTAIAIGVSAIAFIYKGDKLLSEMIPFVTLLIAYKKFSTNLKEELSTEPSDPHE